jgi:hypothetical protein
MIQLCRIIQEMNGLLESVTRRASEILDPAIKPSNLRELPKDIVQLSGKTIDYYKGLITPELMQTFPKFDCGVQSVNLLISGQSVTGKLLDGGGTKTAYEISRNGKKEVILLPNKIRNWKKVLDEVENTKKIRAIGLLVNDSCEVEPIIVNGQTFPALKMKPYSEHDFTIFDSKNRSSSTGNLDDTISIEGLTIDKIVPLFDHILKDIKTLIDHNLRLGSDCFNMAQSKDGTLRLFINDLGEIPENSGIIENKQRVMETYIKRAIDNFFSGFSDKAYYASKELEELGSSENTSILTERLLAKINIQ